MAFDWREYLTLARWLQTNTPPGLSEECARRCAVGKAYYAAYGHARNYAVANLGFVSRNNADDHGRLRAHLKQKRRGRTADCLDRLREWRNQCDYDDDLGGGMVPLDAMLASALQEADYVFSSLPPPASSSAPPDAGTPG
jgi:hypothetical protein